MFVNKEPTLVVLPGKPERPVCVACDVHTAKIHREIHGGMDMLLCNDWRTCNRTSGVITV
jgi:hypothetical protein